jgi:hypothetical protein
MTSKRVDPIEFEAAVSEAQAYLTVAFELLAPYLVVLTDDERLSVPRTRTGFLEAGRKLALAIDGHPAVAQAAEYNPIAAGECLDNVAQLNRLTSKLSELTQRIADSRLVWLADAWGPSLAVYAAAKALATRQGALRTIVQALAPIFATPKSSKKGRARCTRRGSRSVSPTEVPLDVLLLDREALRGVLRARFQ